MRRRTNEKGSGIDGQDTALGLILAAFALIMAGAGKGSDAMCGCGFLLILAAMLYPPLREIGEKRKP